MQKFLLSLAGAMLAMTSLPATADTTLTYSNGESGSPTLYSTSSLATGQALHLSASKLAMLKGRTIKALEIVTGTKKVDNFRIIIGTDLNNPTYTQDATIGRAIRWINYDLTTPYTITGDEQDLYIGYTGTIQTGGTYELLSADLSTPIPAVGYALADGTWRDIAPLNVGCPNIRLILDGDMDFADLTLKPAQTDRYNQAGRSAAFPAQVYNFGTRTIDGFTATTKIGNGEPVSLTFNAAILPGQSFDFTLPEYVTDQAGEQPIEVTVTANDDADTGDNVYTAPVYFYPADMERSILLESFTGQACVMCPAGHEATASVLAAWDGPEVVQVEHHAGYKPDDFTMYQDAEYMFLYGTASTYAPASCVNRLPYGNTGVPTFTTEAKTLQTTLQGATELEPYVSLSLSSNYNAETRALDIHVEAYPHRDLPDVQANVINVLLCQNSLSGDQVGVGETTFNHVFRGSLTGNAWGVGRDFRAGHNEVLDINTTLPENIISDYWNTESAEDGDMSPYTHATDPENMYLVAYVASYKDNDVTGMRVYNCAQVPLVNGAKTQNGFVGISAPIVEQAVPAIRVNGRNVTTDADASLNVFTLQGAAVPATDLAPGIYIARATSAQGVSTARKLVIK